MAKKRKPDKITITAEEARHLDAAARREARLDAELRKTATQPHVDRKKEAKKKACRGKVERMEPPSFFIGLDDTNGASFPHEAQRMMNFTRTLRCQKL